MRNPALRKNPEKRQEDTRKTRRQRILKGLSLIIKILKEKNPFSAKWRVEIAGHHGQ
jgi:hypothetical protein